MYNSKILQYISSHPSSWREGLKGKNIRVHDKDGLTIFNYAMNADFNDPVVQEARGIILDTDMMKVVCWPFRKFGNWNEPYADTIDWNSAQVQQKIDGSIIKFYFHNGWKIATNGMIDANDAECGQTIGKTFADLVKESINYPELMGNLLNDMAHSIHVVNFTYIFELVSPENRIVIPYPENRLYLLGVRHNVSGQEIPFDKLPSWKDFARPAIYPCSDFDGCLKFMNEHFNNNPEQITDEGFVVVDKNWHRIKIKTQEYVDLHHKIANHTLSASKIVDYLLHTPSELDEVLSVIHNPVVHQAVDFYRNELEILTEEIDFYLNHARAEYGALGQDRKKFAARFSQDAWKGFAFTAISNKDATALLLLQKMPVSKVLGMMPEFDPSVAGEELNL